MELIGLYKYNLTICLQIHGIKKCLILNVSSYKVNNKLSNLVSKVPCIVHIKFLCKYRIMVFNNTFFQNYFSYIVAVTFTGGGNRST